ncbi:MAG TPA: response regulator [Armatimonadota bacterium]|nr:response regulator [Armatimonadota bacterium]HQK95515.1 response regulator [Armatimonadota bacterium]
MVPFALRILVADDEELIREALVDVLGATQHTVVAAADGQVAIEALASQEFDLVFTDVVMPRATGIQVLEAALSQKRPPRVVVVSGKEIAHSERDFLDYGAYAYFRKPYRLADILSVTQRVAAELAAVCAR